MGSGLAAYTAMKAEPGSGPVTEMRSWTEKRWGQRLRQGLAPDQGLRQGLGLTHEKDQWLSLTQGKGQGLSLRQCHGGDMI